MSTVVPAPPLAPLAAPPLAAPATVLSADEPRYVLSYARDEEDVRAAQRLRHLVFSAEFGARSETFEGSEPGLDSDVFDAYCDHLLVREESTGEVVGTYRLLPPGAARAAGRLYSDGEFDLTRLAPIRDDLVEVGRSCATRCTAPAPSSA